jgi:hypothetical protein
MCLRNLNCVKKLVIYSPTPANVSADGDNKPQAFLYAEFYPYNQIFLSLRALQLFAGTDLGMWR